MHFLIALKTGLVISEPAILLARVLSVSKFSRRLLKCLLKITTSSSFLLIVLLFTNSFLLSEACQLIVNTDTFSPETTDKTFEINKDLLNCNLKKVAYLLECKKCKNQYVGKAQTKFRMSLNNYKRAHRSFKIKKRITQKLFHGHYKQDDHKGKDDQQFKLIHQCTTNAKLRKREVYCQHGLKTFLRNGLNEREESCLQ